MKTALFVAVALASVASSASAITITTLDLTTTGSTGTINGATFTQGAPKSTGSGVIQPFLRVQDSGSGGVEQGYNTGGGLVFDDKGGISLHNSDLSVSDLSGGTLLLDANEAGGTKNLLTLDQLKIYVSPTHNLTATTLSSLGTLVYDMDGAGNYSVLIDSMLTSGSGSGDVFIKLPSSLFTGYASTDAVYVYSRFGDGVAADGGFEEFALVLPGAGNPGVPEPMSLSLLSVGLVGLALRRRV